MQKLIIALAILLAAGLGCDRTTTAASEKARKDADESAERARQEERQTRDSAKRAFDARMDEIEHRLKALREDTRRQSKKMQRQTKEQIDKLEAELKDLRAKLSPAEEKTAEAWHNLKAATESALAKLERKVDELRSDKKDKDKDQSDRK